MVINDPQVNSLLISVLFDMDLKVFIGNKRYVFGWKESSYV